MQATNKVVTHFLILTCAFFSNNITAQTESNSNGQDCIEHKYSQKGVDKFKNKLKLSIQIHSITHGRTVLFGQFEPYKEILKNESSVIPIDDTHAIKVCIARIVDYGKKTYLYKITFLEKDECWIEMSASYNWHEFLPGVVSSAHYIGYEGTEEYYGFEGEMRIE